MRRCRPSALGLEHKKAFTGVLRRQRGQATGSASNGHDADGQWSPTA